MIGMQEITKSVEILNCSLTDIDTLTEVAHKTYREHYQYLWKDKGEHYIKTSYNPEAFQKEMQDKNVGLYLVTQTSVVYGFLKLNFAAAFNDYTAQEALELERIYLLKKAKGKGIGKAVMKAVDNIANHLNKKVIWLKTMDSSGVDTFYKYCGYTVCGETKLNVAGIFPDFQRQLIMKKTL